MDCIHWAPWVSSFQLGLACQRNGEEIRRQKGERWEHLFPKLLTQLLQGHRLLSLRSGNQNHCSVAESCLTTWDPMDPYFREIEWLLLTVHHQPNCCLGRFTYKYQKHNKFIYPSFTAITPLLSLPLKPANTLSWSSHWLFGGVKQCLFQWVNLKVWELASLCFFNPHSYLKPLSSFQFYLENVSIPSTLSPSPLSYLKAYLKALSLPPRLSPWFEPGPSPAVQWKNKLAKIQILLYHWDLLCLVHKVLPNVVLAYFASLISHHLPSKSLPEGIWSDTLHPLWGLLLL